MTARIYRYEVPVDDREHVFELHDKVLAVSCRRVDVVEFWVTHDDALPAGSGRTARLKVVGTGQTLPNRWAYVGTAVAPGRVLVWHLIEVTP